MNITSDMVQIAWAAGLIEGEGSIQTGEGRYSSHTGRRIVAVRIRVVMSDPDVVERLRDIFGVGNILPYRNTQGLGKKPLFRWDTSRHDEVKSICQAIYPFMGERRRGQIDRLLAAVAANPPSTHSERVRRRWATIKARVAS